jgi:hypothetical protein
MRPATAIIETTPGTVIPAAAPGLGLAVAAPPVDPVEVCDELLVEPVLEVDPVLAVVVALVAAGSVVPVALALRVVAAAAL